VVSDSREANSMANSGELLGLDQRSPAAAELTARIAWLIRLRWLAVAGLFCLLELSRRVLRLQLTLLPIYLTLIGIAAYNILVALIFRRLQRRQRPAEADPMGRLASAQLAVDLLFLAVLLHFSGGIDNPLVFFFVFHVIVASILLSRLATFTYATLGSVLVAAVALGEYFGILPHYSLYGTSSVSAYSDLKVVSFELLVVGTTLFLSAYIGSAIAGNQRRRMRESVRLSVALVEKARLLEEAYQRASESERAKSQYMRKVAHELRGPLGTIQTALKVVLQGSSGTSAEKSRELIARAERRAGEVAQVTLDLLALSRAQELPLELEMTAVEPAELVAEVIAELSGAAKQGGVTLSSSVPHKLGTFKADPDGLTQLVRNLVENAIRYTPRGGRVEVRMGRGERGLRLEVEDTGIGIPDEDQPRVFEEFYRAANAREFSSEGTGLGLAIVSAVAEQHAGCVTINSTPGRGTLAVVDLALAELGPKRQRPT
jgi:signal transduction histidine kinase